MHYWHQIPAQDEEEIVNAIIEIPSGSFCKYEYDKDYGIIRLDRVLFTSTHYPANYGFIPQTFAEDDDPMDIMVLCRRTVVPGTLMRARIIGVFHMVDQGHNDEKMLAVSADDPTYEKIGHIFQLPEHLVEEITHFFKVYKELENKETSVSKFSGPEVAWRILKESQERYDKLYGDKKEE